MSLFALPPEAKTALAEFKALCEDIRAIRKLLERQDEREELRLHYDHLHVATGPVESPEPVTPTQ